MEEKPNNYIAEIAGTAIAFVGSKLLLDNKLENKVVDTA